MLMLARKVHHLRGFCFGDFVGENTALADSVMMDVQHDLCCGLGVFLEKFFQNYLVTSHWRPFFIAMRIVQQMFIKNYSSNKNYKYSY